MEPLHANPKRMVLDLLSTFQGRTLPAATLVRAGQVIGFDGAAVRMALSRLARAGQVHAPTRGHWELTPIAQTVAAHVQGWRKLEDQLRDWEGDWVGVATGGLPRTEDRAAMKRRQRALELWGFRELRTELAIRPNNRVQTPQQVGQALQELGLPPSAPVFQIILSEPHQLEALELWSGDDLNRRYEDHREALATATERLHSLSPDEAAKQTYLVGGAVLRLLAFDPLLPDPIVNVALRTGLIEDMKCFDRLGRAAWNTTLGLSESSP